MALLDYSGLQLFWNKLKEIFITLHTKITFLEEKIKDYSNGIVRITYSELKQLRDSGELSPGTWYRITDYETTVYNNANACAAGHPFDILVLATDVNQLSEDAKAVRSARDTRVILRTQIWQHGNSNTHWIMTVQNSHGQVMAVRSGVLHYLN